MVSLHALEEGPVAEAGAAAAWAYMVKHKKIRAEALGEIVADSSLLSAQEMGHGGVYVSWRCAVRLRWTVSGCTWPAMHCFAGKNALRDVIRQH